MAGASPESPTSTMKKDDLKLLKDFIKEEISRNYHTTSNDPNMWDDFEDFQIEYYPLESGQYAVDISFKNEKLTPTARFNNEAECKHFARMVVDKHRVTAMNHQL